MIFRGTRRGKARRRTSSRSASRPAKQMARKRRDTTVPAWSLISALIVVAGGSAIWVWAPARDVSELPYTIQHIQPLHLSPESFSDSLAVRAPDVLAGLGVPEGEVTSSRLPDQRGSEMRWEISSDVPSDLPLTVCNLELSLMAKRFGGAVLDARVDLSGRTLSMLLGFDGEGTNLVTLRRNPNIKRTAGRIAIIVDDFGNQSEDLIEGFCQLDEPLTLSIFPEGEKAGWIAERAVAGGHGVMIHLPMEPIDYPTRNPGPDAIFLDYSEQRIRQITRQALGAVPHAAGFNNHMGSRLTQDALAMSYVLAEARQRDFYFVDSVTSPKSVAYDVAREMGLSCARNTRFVDLVEEAPAVEDAVMKLAKQARQEGTVIGIGHAKAPTLYALQRMMPELRKQGFVFVTAKQAVR